MKRRDSKARVSSANSPTKECWTFDEVFAAEYKELRKRCSKIKAEDADGQKPAVDNDLIGVALSGGGIRSATFCLGALQAMNTAKILQNVNYLSTVSGGGYIGTATTIAMSTQPHEFPFSKTGHDVGETLETGHLRDNSRYLVQRGALSVISAVGIYLRGLTMNTIVVLPLLLIAAALLVFLKPDTIHLVAAWPFVTNHFPFAAESPMPLSTLGLIVVAFLLVVYAIGVSVFPIVSLPWRQAIAVVAMIVIIVFGVTVSLELHLVLLRAAFSAQHMINLPAATPSGSAQIPDTLIEKANQLVRWATPFVLAILPFLKSIGAKAASDVSSGFTDQLKKWASRIVLVVAAAIVPLLLWLTVLQLAFWGIGVGDLASGKATWAHAPGFFIKLFDYAAGCVPSIEPHAVCAYLAVAVIFLIAWPFLNVNANSLHQLYRDRLGSAFLVKRNASKLEPADDFSLQNIDSTHAPYHLLNAALNVPGSNYANRRGRNADFFIFSRNFVGSEATGYVPTKEAEEVNDGLNIGTAMAISGAAAAPNMGMASLRPLSATIALLNIRLGRWLRHPRSTMKKAGRSRLVLWWQGKPGPIYLLREAFFKSGSKVVDPNTEAPLPKSFVFLTDGGHIENLGIYELLKRRCALIIAIDGEADAEMTSGSLVQLERFARIDLGTRISLNWEPIGRRSREVSKEVASRSVDKRHGPHVAVGLIDYPADPGGTADQGVLVYVKSSLSGDENDYVMAYKAAHPSFPHETTMDQLFTEEQFEAYRALGEHMMGRFLDGSDAFALADGLDAKTAVDRIDLAYR